LGAAIVLLAIAAPVAGIGEARPGHTRARAASHGGGQGTWDGGRGGGDSAQRGDGGGRQRSDAGASGDQGGSAGGGGAGSESSRGQEDRGGGDRQSSGGGGSRGASDRQSSGVGGSRGEGDHGSPGGGRSHGEGDHRSGGGSRGEGDHRSSGGGGSGHEKSGGKSHGEKSGGGGEKSRRGGLGRESSSGDSGEESGAGLPSRFGQGRRGRLPSAVPPGSLGGPTSSPTPGPASVVPGIVSTPRAVVPAGAPPAVTPQPRGGGAPASGSRLGQVLTTAFPASGPASGLVSAAARSETTAESRPAKRTGGSRSRGGGTPAPPANPVSRVIEAVPTAIWFVLGGLAALALTLGGAALVAGARARRRGHAIQAIEGLAISDALTGVLNRGAFEERLRGELARARRYSRPLGLLTFDVDGLKAVNDAHGHSAGDEVLKAVAAVITASIRDHDLCGRMGGDEYAVVVTEQSRAGAERVLERIQSEVPKHREALGLRTQWGLSAGIAEFPNDGDTAEALLKAADRRLYLSRGIHIQPVS
jgi:diguanylate cyclase (GGDEF)-like protein